MIGMGGGEGVAQPVEGFQLLRLLDVMLRHPADHLSPGHLAHGALFHHLAVLLLAKGAGEEGNGGGQVGGDRFAVLLGGQIDHQIGLSGQGRCQLIPPEGVQILVAVHLQGSGHLQPVGGHPVEGAQQSVKAGEDAQMFLHIVQLLPLEDAGGHVLVLDALIGQQGRGEVLLQVHVGQPLQVKGGDGIVALPQLLQGGAVHGLQRRQQPPGLRQKGRQAVGGEAVGVHPHFLGW